MPKERVRQEKERAVDELADKLGRSQMVVLTDYRGLSVAEMSNLRGRLRQAGAEYQVAKNTLTRFAAERAGRTAILPELEGPTAIAFGYDDPTVAAKAVNDVARGSRNALGIKGGVLGTQALSPAQIESLANLPPREVLLGRVLGGIQGPSYRLVGVLTASLRNLASVLDQRAKQMGEAGTG